MKKKVFFSLLLLCSMPALASVLPFLDRSFKDFVNNRVPGPLRDKYAEYVDKLDKKLDDAAEKDRMKLQTSLCSVALDAMRNQHKAWEKEIVSFMEGVQFLDSKYNDERKDLQNFLYWSGALEKFQGQASSTMRVAKVDEKKDIARASTKEVLGNVKTKLAEATNKVGDWLRSLRS